MMNKEHLYKELNNIDGRGYKAYRQIQNNYYDFGKFIIGIPYVQGDPYASPSSVIIKTKGKIKDFPEWLFENEIRLQAVEDYLTRVITNNIKKYARGNRGSGKSGRINIVHTGQEVIKRTSVEFSRDYIEARLTVGLPAKGRRVLGHQAQDLFFKEISKITENSLFLANINQQALENHVRVVEDQHVLRELLSSQGLLAFIADGSILPRRSGVDDRPLSSNKVVPFQSPAEYELSFKLPHKGEIKGMGIKEGITLIVGGGYHGKSTLLNAIERGVYNHIPGDGREYVVTRHSAFKIRAEDGRRVERVDISPFINNLPQGETTKDFSTDNASGSTSQAANIIEALELGAGVLLIDEDTCATNFMIRDARMQKLVADKNEPITPFIDKVKPLYNEHNVSTILVVGGAGDYFDVADRVIMMNKYRPIAVTEEVKDIASKLPTKRESKLNTSFGQICQRIPEPASINPRRKGRIKVKTYGMDTIQFGRENIDLSYLEQLVNQEQSKTIADILTYAITNDIIDGQRTIREILDRIYEHLQQKGLKIISPFNSPAGAYVLPRPYEVGGALNRLRSLKIKDIIY
nr:ABC-ATPase domain-containing protein [Halocella sp. SP3-1]